MKLKKLQLKHVLIAIEKLEKSKSGIYLPDDNFVSEKARVVQKADDCEFVKIGDIVLFKSYAPDYFSEEGEEYAIIDEKNIKAIL